MRTIQISEGQTLTDIAAQHCGDASMAFEIALLNGLDIDDVAFGMYLQVPDFAIDKKAIVLALANEGIEPASALTTPLVNEDWAIWWGEY